MRKRGRPAIYNHPQPLSQKKRKTENPKRSRKGKRVTLISDETSLPKDLVKIITQYAPEPRRRKVCAFCARKNVPHHIRCPLLRAEGCDCDPSCHRHSRFCPTVIYRSSVTVTYDEAQEKMNLFDLTHGPPFGENFDVYDIGYAPLEERNTITLEELERFALFPPNISKRDFGIELIHY